MTGGWREKIRLIDHHIIASIDQSINRNEKKNVSLYRFLRSSISTTINFIEENCHPQLRCVPQMMQSLKRTDSDDGNTPA